MVAWRFIFIFPLLCFQNLVVWPRLELTTTVCSMRAVCSWLWSKVDQKGRLSYNLFDLSEKYQIWHFVPFHMLHYLLDHFVNSVKVQLLLPNFCLTQCLKITSKSLIFTTLLQFSKDCEWPGIIFIYEAILWEFSQQIVSHYTPQKIS